MSKKTVHVNGYKRKNGTPVVSHMRGPGRPSSDKIKGGMADKIQTRNFDKRFLEKGKKVEYEHTNDPTLAKEIAKDHGVETDKDPGPRVKSDYYHETKGLPAMEHRLEKQAEKEREKALKKSK